MQVISSKYGCQSVKRRGTILPLLATTCFALFAFIALAVDLGMLMVARTECQNAADTAALIAARTLDNNVPVGTPVHAYDNQRPAAIAAAVTNVQSNYLLRSQFAFNDASVDRVEIGAYDYDTTDQTFKPRFHPITVTDPSVKLTGSSGSTLPWTAARVTVKGDQPTYFARIFGVSSMPMLARATAVHRPRDIAMVLDYSGSMKFGCEANYPPGSGGSNGVVQGLLSIDPRFPQFGHYQRYDVRLTSTNPNVAGAHPFRSTVPYVMSSGEIASPNNLTFESAGGPPMVNDFQTSTNPNPSAPVNPAQLSNAFVNNVTPAPSSYSNQAVAFSTSSRGPLGDRFPRKGGLRFETNVTWDATNNNGSARNAAELLFANGSLPVTPAERDIPTMTGPPSRANTFPNGNRKHWSNSWASFIDNAWEHYGYDLNIPAYIASGYTTATTRTTELFQGYTLGPGHWGKTFFIWPPDPRYGPPPGVARTIGASGNLPDVTRPDPNRLSHDLDGRPMCDWRQRFFLKGDGTPFNPQVDNINGLLLNTSTTLATGSGIAPVLNATTSNYTINYRAILAWLKSGPQTLPPNLRAGRILFYTYIPDDCANPTDLDQRFWREYIDFVLGTMKNRTWYNPAYCMAGVETNTSDAWGSSRSITATAAYTPTTPVGAPANPRPYMNYRDTPVMPRAHFWFGPASMLMFISTRGQFTGSKEWNWNPGTVREAQCWQLKAAVQSCLEDIRRNHPNDQVGLAFFAHSNYRTPRAPMSQEFDRLKAALFYPKNIPGGPDNGAFLTDVINQAVREVRPYDNNMNSTLVGNLPNANGGTDPNNGLAQAYNLCSPSTSGANGANGRRGASKIIIFETDGVPNAYQEWEFISAGANSRYNWLNAGAFVSNGDSGVMNQAYAIAQRFVQPTTHATTPGFSLPNSPARIYPFGFGDLFSSGSSFRPTAETFLQTLAFHGNTNSSSSTTLPVGQIITGDYNTRINNLRDGLERVLQNGVQVSLIE